MDAEKKGKKKWYTLTADEQFRNVVIGEVPGYSAERLIGRSLWVNLAHLTNDLKDHSIRVRFKVTKVIGERAEAEVIGYDVLNTYIKRIVRPGRDRIDDSFVVHNLEKNKLRIKMIYLTRSNVTRGIAREIMKKGRELATEFFEKNNYYGALHEIIANRFQRNLKSILNKIYPLSSVDVRAIELSK